MNNSRQSWIKVGYELVAINGIENLKIEKLSKLVGKSKSSFYHLFVDLDNFENYLLEHHIQNCLIISKKEEQSKKIDPHLIDILIEHKIDLLFNKQIRFYREKEKFEKIVVKTNDIIIIPFLKIWKTDLNLQLNELQLEGLFKLALENFYLQINSKNLEREWLISFFFGLKGLIRSISI